jgi:hypothetical protein
MRCQGSLPVTSQQYNLGLSTKYVTNQYRSNLDEKFDSLVKKRKIDVIKMFEILQTTQLSRILSDELILLIAEIANPERDYDLNLVFQRKKFWQKDTYYLFTGTKPRLNHALLNLKEAGRSNEDNDLMDVPFDKPLRWTLFIFDIKSQYDKCVENIVRNGQRVSASGNVKICDISKV